MRYEDYAKLPGVNWSRLKLLRKSPLHYHTAVSADSAAFKVGRALHSLVLGQGDPVVCYEDRRAGKKWDEFQIKHADATILRSTEFELVSAMAGAIRRDELACSVLAETEETESPLTWRDTKTSAKGLLDVRLSASGSHGGGIVDIKTAADVSEEAFKRAAASLGYFDQLAWYARGWRKVHGEWPAYVGIVAVEKAFPFAVGTYRISRETIRDLQPRIDSLLTKLWDCTLSGRWPGPTPAITVLEPPAWLIAGDERDVPEIELDGMVVT